MMGGVYPTHMKWRRANKTIIKNMHPLSSPPRIFISYARSDGEDFARQLRHRLTEEHKFAVWQDRTEMQVGEAWWQQIVAALSNEHIEYMVLVMTPAAMRSEMVRKEWRRARQEGVCVLPVIAKPGLDFENLPLWMRAVHFTDPGIDEQWTRFIGTLGSPCQQKRVPFMVEDLPEDFVARPNEFNELVGRLLNEKQDSAIAITAALRGAGGYGKTTLAKALCHNERIQEAFYDGILWVTLGEKPGDLTGRVGDLIEILSGERSGFEGSDAATSRLMELLADRHILIVIDDVWNIAHLKPFIQGGPKVLILIILFLKD
jgi:ribosomal protein L39E